MAATYVVTGVQTDGRNLRLDEDLPLLNERLRIIVETVAVKQPGRSYAEVMAGIRLRQEARGHSPMTRREIDAYVQAERESWDNE